MRRGIGLRGYAQQDPLNEFRKEAYRLYEELSDLIRRQVATTIFRVTVTREPATVPLSGPGQPARGPVQHTHADGSVHDGPPHDETSGNGSRLRSRRPRSRRRQRRPRAAGAATAFGRATTRPVRARSPGCPPTRCAPRARRRATRRRRTASARASRRRAPGSGATTRAGAGRARSTRSVTGPERPGRRRDRAPRPSSRASWSPPSGGFAALRIWQQGDIDERAPRRRDRRARRGPVRRPARPPCSEARLDHAIALFRAGVAPHLVVTGGKQPGDRTTEAAVARRYAIDHGVPADAIFGEDEARNTLESLRAVAGRCTTAGCRARCSSRTRPTCCGSSGSPTDLGLEAYSSPTRTSPVQGDLVGRIRATVHELGALAVYLVTGGARRRGATDPRRLSRASHRERSRRSGPSDVTGRDFAQFPCAIPFDPLDCAWAAPILGPSPSAAPGPAPKPSRARIQPRRRRTDPSHRPPAKDEERGTCEAGRGSPVRGSHRL